MDDLRELLPCQRRNVDATDAAIRRALRAGDLVASRRGVLVGTARIDAAVTAAQRHVLATQVAIAAVAGPPAYAALGSAAVLHEFDRLGRSPQRVRLYRSSGARWRDAHAAVLVCGLPAGHCAEVAGVPCTSPPRTVVDLARWVGFRGGVVVADSALRRGVTRSQLETVAADCARWPGVRRAREVIAFADGRAQSPLESVSRVAFHEWGLPPPELQKAVAWDWVGNPTCIVDFVWEGCRVVGEADGLLKYGAEFGDDGTGSVLRAEKLRQEQIEDLGYVVVRWTWDDIWRRPEWVAMRIRRAMQKQAHGRR